MSTRDNTTLTLESYVRGVVRAVGVQLLLVTVLTGAVFAYLLLRLGPQLEGAIDNARTVRIIHETMLDQETSLRDYLITGDAESLVPYERGRATMVDATDEADSSLTSHRKFGDDFVAVRLAQQRWIDQWAAPAATGGPEQFESNVELDRFIRDGRTLFDRYRVLEEDLIDGLIDERSRLMDVQRTVLLTSAIIALATGAALLVITLRKRKQIDAIVVEPVEDLRRTMERISRGDFTARPSRAGTLEMQQLADSLDDMSDQLHDALRIVAEQSATLSERSNRQASILGMARDIAGSLNVGYVQRAVAEQARRLASATSASVWVMRDQGDRREMVEAWHEGDDSSGPSETRLELGQGLAGEVARDGRAKTTDERGTPSVAVILDQPVAALGLPMIVGARVIGVIEVCFDPAQETDAEAVAMVETLASHAGTAIEAARLHEATRELAQIDALTALYNRRRMDSDLADEIGRSDRYHRPLAFVMTDLDNFKQFNDTYGHQRGDEVLQEVARLLAGAVRSTDTVYRYGGEELSILFRETTLADALDLAERLRAEVAAHFPARDGQRAVTISMGVAALAEGVSTAEELVGAADAALYEAKAGGRNKVVSAA